MVIGVIVELVYSPVLVTSVEPIVTAASKVTGVFGIFDKGHKSKN